VRRKNEAGGPEQINTSLLLYRLYDFQSGVR
jgi:hypothetical protein